MASSSTAGSDQRTYAGAGEVPRMAQLIAPTARLIDAESGRALAGSELRSAVDEYASALGLSPPGLVFALTDTTVSAVLRYLGAFSLHRPIALLDRRLKPAVIAALIRRFTPAVVIGIEHLLDEGALARPGGYSLATLGPAGRAWMRTAAAGERPHPDLAVLLATSGSTGNPKLVRLSRAAILANAQAIARVLHISAEEIAPTGLPLFYSYGMSVLNSHLTAGGTVLVVGGGVLTEPFWDACSRFGATSLAGVPYHYEMLARIRWHASMQPSLRKLTQAGGRMSEPLVASFGAQLPLYVMYGQTEAGPRMTTLPPEWLPAKPGSVGPAIPGGRLSVLASDGTETAAPDTEGEVVFRGPSVMMGYAEGAGDLVRGDDLGGTLRTGDIGRLDADGCLRLTGRVARFGKAFGIRVNLDDVEAVVRRDVPAAVVAGDDKVIVYCESLPAAERRSMASRLAMHLNLHRSGFEIRSVDRLPLLPSGKVDYAMLANARGAT